MKKRIALSILMLAMLGACLSSALAQGLPDSMFENAKEAVSLISYGEFKRALTKLNFAGGAISASDLEDYIDSNCRYIYSQSVQREVAVSWYDGSRWALAVPLEAPDDAAVGALVFYSANGADFDGMEYLCWGDVEDAYGAGSDIYWNVAYDPEYIIVGDW